MAGDGGAVLLDPHRRLLPPAPRRRIRREFATGAVNIAGAA